MGKFNFKVNGSNKSIDLSSTYSSYYIGSDTYENADYWGNTFQPFYNTTKGNRDHHWERWAAPCREWDHTPTYP